MKQNGDSEMEVLINPATDTLSNSTYGKTFNIVGNLNSGDVDVSLVVNSVEDVLERPNVNVRSLQTGSRVTYYLRTFASAYRSLNQDEFDVYHHMNLNYRWFNPLLLGNLQGETPTLIGPAQAPHFLTTEELRMKLDWSTSDRFPELAIDALQVALEKIIPVLNNIRENLFARTLQAADRIVVVNEETKNLYSEFVDSSRIEVIPLGVDLDLFPYSDERDDRTIVTVGRLTRRKGFDVLIKAMPEIIEEHPHASLHVYGEGPLKSRLRSLAQDCGVADSVTFEGYVSQDELSSVFQNAAVFAHPSRSESFSPVRLEAMASGCPIVATDIVGAQEMIRNGKDGYVVPTESAPEIAEGIVAVLNDSDRRAEMSRNARNHVEAKYDWRDIGQQYLDIYQQLSGKF